MSEENQVEYGIGDVIDTDNPKAIFDSTDNVIAFSVHGKEVIKLTQDCAYLYGVKLDDMGKLHDEFLRFFQIAKETKIN